MMKISATRARLLALSLFCSFCFNWVFVLPAVSFQAADIEIPASPDSNASSYSVVPDSLTEHQRKWLRILESPAPSIGDEIMTCEALLEKLRAIGLPVVVDTTARDDQLSDEEPLQVLFPTGVLLDRLENTLEEKNAVITMDSGHVRLISMDNAQDSRNLMLVAYDLTGAPDIEALLESCRSLDPNQEFLNGSNTNALRINGRLVVAINAPFYLHMKIRRLFQAIAVHTGPFVEGAAFQGVSRSIPVSGRMPRTTISTAGHKLGSTPVALPEKKQKAGINFSKEDSNFGGMGGGMFRIGEQKH